MVQINSEAEWVAMKKQRPDPNGLSDIDLDVIGGPVRIEIDFRDPYALKAQLDLLKGMITRIEVKMGTTEWQLRTRLFEAATEARIVAKRMRSQHRRKE